MDLSHLLEPRAGDGPSGENLEYDAAFSAMELAAMPGEERQVGDSVIAAEEPDHKEVSARALEVLEQSHDLRAAACLAYARLRLDGLPGLAGVTAYMRGCLERYWDSCHPQLDADDDDDPTMRVNAVLALTDANTVLRALRLAPLSDSRAFGRMCLRDIAVAEGDIPAPADMDQIPDPAAISAAFQDTDPDLLTERLAAARQVLGDVRAIGAVFDDRIPGQGPDFDPLEKLLRQIIRALETATGDSGDSDAAAEDDSPAPAMGAGAGAGTGAGTGGGGGAINGPNDVTNAIDRIVAYYERAEPSSPVPLLLARARRLVGASFLEIVKDMAPNGVDNVNVIGGLEDDD